MPEKQYVPFSKEDKYYPNELGLLCECGICGDILPVHPDDSMFCSCGNILIDIDYARFAVKNKDEIRFFIYKESE